MIDRLLRSALEREGADLHGIADALISQGSDVGSVHGETRLARKNVGGRDYDLKQDGLDPPVISTSVPLGKASYHGDWLFVCEVLPQTLCAAAVGRRLGDVVSTGISALDDRPILKVRICHNGFPPTEGTLFSFATDLVELG